MWGNIGLQVSSESRMTQRYMAFHFVLTFYDSSINIWYLLLCYSVHLLTTIKEHLCAHLRAMCSSQDPLITDERTTTEWSTINYESSLPWALTAGCCATTGDTIGLFIQRHMDFSSELFEANKHISMQQQKQYVRADINTSDNY